MEKPKNHALIKRLIFVGLLSTLFWSFLLLYSNAIISPHILRHPPLITPQSNAFIVITRPTITTSSADEQTQDSTPTSTSTPTDAGIDTESPSISTGNPSSTSPPPPPNTTRINNDPCSGKYIYVHDLPPRFNDDILKQCDSIIPWSNVCKFVSNAGLGPKLMTGKQESDDGATTTTRPKSSLVPEGRWYASDQYSVEVIFRNRMKQYECLTRDSSKASAVYVPFYAGFDIARYLWDKHNVSVRDSTSLDLIRWLTNAPEWKLMGGKDHFLVVGRTTYDFRRLTDNDSDWGNKLFILPESRNMSFLLVEASPWDTNDFGIPFPTYFHPTKDSDVFLWQSRVRRHSRKWLFSFVGAPRPGNPYSIRTQLINQCKNSSVCNLLSCASKQGHRCHSPRNVMRVFQTSTFCLQPPGDSYTRRSVFDSMLAGCIPVFFHPGTAYVQYRWHLPTNYSSYSVFIPEEDVREGKVRVEEVLRRVGSKEVKEMRERIVGMIPSFLYADPRSAKLETVKDAFDVTVEAVIQRVNTLRLLNEGIIEEGKQDEVGDKWDRYFIKGQRRA